MATKKRKTEREFFDMVQHHQDGKGEYTKIYMTPSELWQWIELRVEHIATN